MSVYLTLVLCATCTSVTSSCSPAFLVDEFPKVACPVETHEVYHEVHKSLGRTETDESKPRTGVLGPEVYDGLV